MGLWNEAACACDGIVGLVVSCSGVAGYVEEVALLKGEFLGRVGVVGGECADNLLGGEGRGRVWL